MNVRSKKLHKFAISKFHYIEPIYNGSHASSPNPIPKRKCNSVYVQHGASSFSICSIYTCILLLLFQPKYISRECVVSFFLSSLYTIPIYYIAVVTHIPIHKRSRDSKLVFPVFSMVLILIYAKLIPQQPLSQHNYKLNSHRSSIEMCVYVVADATSNDNV